MKHSIKHGDVFRDLLTPNSIIIITENKQFFTTCTKIDEDVVYLREIALNRKFGGRGVQHCGEFLLNILAPCWED